jgi:NAD(P)-dependent dehydrogenase (short-subunit alcohol dehydrogenase family)
MVSAPSRIINVSSLAHKYGKIEHDDFDGKKNLSIGQAYSKSKLMNVLFTRELAQRLQEAKISVNSCHPGTYSKIGRDEIRLYFSKFQRCRSN